MLCEVFFCDSSRCTLVFFVDGRQGCRIKCYLRLCRAFFQHCHNRSAEPTIKMIGIAANAKLEQDCHHPNNEIALNILATQRYKNSHKSDPS